LPPARVASYKFQASQFSNRRTLVVLLDIPSVVLANAQRKTTTELSGSQRKFFEVWAADFPTLSGAVKRSRILRPTHKDG